MGLYDLADRLNWQQACIFLGIKRSAFFKLVQNGRVPAYGLARNRFYLKSDLQAYLEQKLRKKAN